MIQKQIKNLYNNLPEHAKHIIISAAIPVASASLGFGGGYIGLLEFPDYINLRRNYHKNPPVAQKLVDNEDAAYHFRSLDRIAQDALSPKEKNFLDQAIAVYGNSAQELAAQHQARADSIRVSEEYTKFITLYKQKSVRRIQKPMVLIEGIFGLIAGSGVYYLLRKYARKKQKRNESENNEVPDSSQIVARQSGESKLEYLTRVRNHMVENTSNADTTKETLR